MKKITKENSLKYLFPNIAKEWHPSLNQGADPDDVAAYSNKKAWWICKDNHEWEAIIANRTRRGNGCPYCSGRLPIIGETDLATLEPEIAKEWNYKKNNDKTPQMYTASSGEKVWWICKEGHEWKTAIGQRKRDGAMRGCPYCAGKLPILGKTDLATVAPQVAAEWNYEKNGKDTPQCFSASSHKKVWWKCKEGHEWEAVIGNRVLQGNRCPYCSGKLPIIGKTDLLTVAPEIFCEWDYDKNGNKSPQMFTKYSNQKVWWKCNKGHEWQAVIGNRTQGNGCPYCAGKVPIVGKTDLATLMPDVAKEWNYEKNKKAPQEYTVSSGEKVWWKCRRDHEWQELISNRTRYGYGCPYCSGKRAIEGETDLATLFPEIAREWNYIKNKKLMPQMFTVYSHKKVWWICQEGHEWKASISQRAYYKTRCPYCAGIKPIAGKTDLKTVYPEIAIDWNYDKNRNKTPDQYTAKSNQKVWWKCNKCKTEWRSCIATRTQGLSNCPNCK